MTEIQKAVNIIKWLVIQHLTPEDDGAYGSGFLSANAEALRFLIKHGEMKELADKGKCVYGWPGEGWIGTQAYTSDASVVEE